jgi:hypothetical protein
MKLKTVDFVGGIKAVDSVLDHRILFENVNFLTA